MKTTKLLLTIILVIGCLFLTTSCKLFESVGLVKHVHEFDSNWTHDENSHYRLCNADECNESSEKAPHSWGVPVITEAQVGKEGSKIYTCTVCKATKTDVIPALEHKHETSEDWISDADKHWNICDNCDTKLNTSSHSWGEPVITEAEVGMNGSKVYTCTVCMATKTDVIPALKHEHNATEGWIFNSDKHWNICDGCDAKLNTSSHTWDDGTVIVESTSDNEVNIRYRCVVCSCTKFETTPTLPNKMSKDEWFSYFDITNVRIDAVMDVGGLVTTNICTLIDGELAIVTIDGESYYSTSEIELSQINFSDSYDDFDHIDNNVYYASMTSIEDLELYDVTIVFADGKIESIYYTMNLMGFDSNIVFTLSEWGNVKIENPALTEKEYESIQSPEKFHTYSLSHNFYKANGSLTATYYVFEGDSYHATYYVDNLDPTENSGVVENAGILFNGALAILSQLSAENFVYDYTYNAFSHLDPDLYIKDTILYFGIVVEDGYLECVYIEYINGDYESYYFDYSEPTGDDLILTEEDYEALLDESKYYNYSYTYYYYDTYTDKYLIWDYIIDGNTYILTSISNDGYTTINRELNNAGVILNSTVLNTLESLHADDFVYDADSGEFVLINLYKLNDTTEYFSITVEDGYLTSINILSSYGTVTSYTYYDYGISDVNAQY